MPPCRRFPLNRSLLSALLALAATACVTIPPQPLLIDSVHGETVDSARCAALAYPRAPHRANRGLDPDGFALLNWNLHRGSESGLEQTLQRLAAGHALLTLQEARLDDDLRATLDALHLQWDFAPGFVLNQYPVGVLNAASVPALARCVRRTTEPWLGIPKIALYTVYTIAGSRVRLLMINLHGVNFSIGTNEFQQQLAQAREIVTAHRGPLLIAGDFNTWSLERTQLVDTLATQLGLREVEFASEQRIRVWGLPLDHIYYRGLRVLNATSSQQAESDHNPLLAQFALEPGHRSELVLNGVQLPATVLPPRPRQEAGQ